MASESPQNKTVVDAHLLRALGLALHGAGFDSVNSQALDSFCAHTEEYMLHFAWRVKESMLSCRRAQPLPQDFTHALAIFTPSPSAFKQDLQLSVPTEVTQPALLSPSPEEPAPNIQELLKTALGGTSEKAQRRFVPPHFPDFPIQHAYKDTPVFTEREVDARRIRERATQEGMLAEQALRKLMAARHAGNNNGRSGRLGKSAKWQASEQIWRDTMAAVLAAGEAQNLSGREADTRFGLDGAADMPATALAELTAQYGAIVNYDRVYWRKGAGNVGVGAL